MPKNGKKKRKLESVSLLSNITGFEDATGQESLDACLAEFQNSTAPQIEQTKKSKTDIPLKDRENFDQIESWNRSFLSWVKGGNYPPGLLPNVDEELSRNFRVKELSTFLLGSGNDLRMPIFERWLLDSKSEEEQSRDHVIPVTTHPKSQASIRLIQELLHNGLDRDDAERVAADLCRKTNVAGHELSSQGDRYRRQSPLKKGDRMRQEDHSGSVSLIYSRKKWKKPFCFKINLSHYQKLKDRFFQLHNQVSTKLEVDDIKTIHAFNILVLALLLRYSALSGGQLLQDLRGGGMQGAIHNEVFEVLKSSIEGPWIEGFASPFNACLDTFGSAFPDIDWHFGSIGSFMDYIFRQGGCCEANPPFSPGVMNQMAHHIERQLDWADQNDVSLTFVVVVPTAKELCSEEKTVKKAASISFQSMLSSSHCRKHIYLAAREHGYLEGSQHLRPTQFKQSVYDTSIILLQSDKGREASHSKIMKMTEDIKAAFASRHKEELKKRRNKD